MSIVLIFVYGEDQANASRFSFKPPEIQQPSFVFGWIPRQLLGFPFSIYKSGRRNITFTLH